MVITIDGFAATGKSTVGELLAEALGYLYFDSGVMYRAITWATLERGISPDDHILVSELAEHIVIDINTGGPDDGRQATVLVDGHDATWDIRQTRVDVNVSRVASYPRVRAALTKQQRRIAANGNIVMVGRDIGTVVLPEAELKIFLNASPEERARRRFEQAQEQNRPADYQEILAAMIQRDKLDQENPVSPTKPADDAVIINTDTMTLEEVVDYIQALAARS